jgi:hypothetical protein
MNKCNSAYLVLPITAGANRCNSVHLVVPFTANTNSWTKYCMKEAIIMKKVLKKQIVKKI